MTKDNRTTESLLSRRELVDKSEITSAVYVETSWGHLICDSSDHGDAAHIAVSDPATVMADIAEILRLREEVESLRREVENLSGQADRLAGWARMKCDEVQRLESEADWLALVLANAGCGVSLTEYIGEAVNGMSPPAPEHWREAARKAVETSHEN